MTSAATSAANPFRRRVLPRVRPPAEITTAMTAEKYIFVLGQSPVLSVEQHVAEIKEPYMGSHWSMLTSMSTSLFFHSYPLENEPNRIVLVRIN